jgi:hypothetical protein
VGRQINGTAGDFTDKVRPQVGVVFTGFIRCDPHGVPVVPRAQQLGWRGTVTVLAPARIRAACARYRTSISR